MKADVISTRQAKSDPMKEKDVKELVSSVSQVLVAKGKAIRVLAAASVTLDDLKGPTGNFRAPMVKIGRKLLVGFHDGTLRKELL